MDRGEKWRAEFEKICGLRGRKRLEYLWDYYKWALVCLAAVVFAVHTVCVMITNSVKNTVLSVVIVDAERTDDDAAEELEEGILEMLGCEGRYDHVETVLSATSMKTEENVAKLRVALSTVGGADLVICGEEVYEEYAAQRAFVETRRLPEAAGISASVIGEYVGYAPVYLCIPEFAERRENARIVIKGIVN